MSSSLSPASKLAAQTSAEEEEEEGGANGRHHLPRTLTSKWSKAHNANVVLCFVFLAMSSMNLSEWGASPMKLAWYTLGITVAVGSIILSML